MLFAFICTDRPGSLELRLRVRPDHLAHLEKLGSSLKAAGPFTDPQGSPNGSLVIIEAANATDAKVIADSDPYAKAGLFQSVEIKPWKWALKNPEA